MSFPNQPWLYDLITAIENHEDVHAKGAPCFDVVLAAVPMDTRREARAIAAYNGAKPTHATDTEHGPFRAIARHEMDASQPGQEPTR
jgi:hypothetical protein